MPVAPPAGRQRNSNYYRDAMRQGGTLFYLLSDHLGSTTQVLNDTGGLVSSERYYPYGRTRSGSVGTDKQFTGHQREDTDLYFMKARFYDPLVGRFLQPDTIVPDYANPQALNRYAYVLGNPLRYTDPTGLCHTEAFPRESDPLCFDMLPGQQGGSNSYDQTVPGATTPPDPRATCGQGLVCPPPGPLGGGSDTCLLCNGVAFVGVAWDNCVYWAWTPLNAAGAPCYGAYADEVFNWATSRSAECYGLVLVGGGWVVATGGASLPEASLLLAEPLGTSCFP